MKIPNLTLNAVLGFALAIIIILACAQESAALQTPGQKSRSCGDLHTQDSLTAVSDDGDLSLSKGQLARLSGIRLPEAAPYHGQAIDYLRTSVGKSLSAQSLGQRDRWGRLPVSIRLLDEKSSSDMSHLLVEAGLAMVDPGSDKTFCQTELLAFEETAREQRLGLWAEARYKPIPAERSALLQERIGSFVIVEGRVRSVGERKQTTYLNFGGHWAEDFTIIIPRNVWPRMAASGIDAAALKGRRIRARGILQSWQGTALTIEMPEMIERLEGNHLPR